MSANFGQYDVVSEIGRGGMGIIYKANDPRLHRMVAIKELVLDNVDPDKKDEFRERFRREAVLAAGLNHPNLIAIYDVSICADHSYYVMELLEGYSLRQALELKPEGRFTPEEFFPLLKQVVDGLAHAHEMNLVHRDIKPDNIFLLPDGKVKLTDFGIARSASEDENSNLTKPGVMLGTLSYVSPEQLQDARNADHRADIYSLGVVAYEALTGQLPLTGDGLTSTLMAIVSKEAKPAHEVYSQLSPELSSVIAKAMRKMPQERYQSVLEFMEQYERTLKLERSKTNSGGWKIQSLTAPKRSQTYMPGIPVALANETTDKNPLPEQPQVVKPWVTAQPTTNSAQIISKSVAIMKPIAVIGRQGEDKGCFLEPAVLCCRFGKIVVADTIKRKLQIFTKDGRWLAESQVNANAKGSKTSGGAFSKPSAVTIDFRGRIFATDSSDHYIRVFNGQGDFTRELCNKQGRDGGILGITCDAQGTLYVSDPDNGCIQILSAEAGTWLRAVGSKGSADWQLKLPSGLALDRLHQLYVVDYGSSKVSIFSKAGIFQKSFGGKGTGKGLFNVPRGIAIDKYDRVYVADSLNHRIQIFSTDGTYLTSFGGRGQEQGKFLGPFDLSIDPDNNCLYVTDKGNYRIQVFELLSE